jgi:hypothetical protein
LSLVIVTALAIAGCGESATPDRASDAPDLRFDFELESKPGFISQTLTIENPGDAALAPVLELTALDASGEPMPDVRVRTAFGSDEGRVVVPQDWAVFDAIRLTNPGDAEIKFRVALIEYEAAPEGESQQWVRVTPLAPLTAVPAGGKKTIRLPARLRGRVIGSVKPYFSR